MILVIHDANIIIDLQSANLLAAFFRLELQSHTSDLIIDELNEPITKQIKARKIQVKNWTPIELAEIAVTQRSQPKSISFQDCSVLILAQRLKGILLTGDANLRYCADKAGIEVRGTLWILDQLVAASLLPPAEAAKRLEKLMENGRRLPEQPVNQRLTQWRNC